MSEDYKIAGGEEAEAVVESTHDTFIFKNHENFLVNSASLGIYAHGRVHQEVARQIYVGDLIHKRGPETTDDILLMEEQATLAHGETLTTNSRLGGLRALAILPTMSTANGEGDLIAYYENGVVAFNTHEAPRESRVDADGGLLTKGWDHKRLVNHLLNVVSAVGRYAVAVLPRDHLFRSNFGVHLLKTVMGEGSFNTEQTNKLSVDVSPILDLDPPTLLSGAAAGHWVQGDRFFCTTGMRWSESVSASPYGRGFVVWNQATTFTEDRTPQPGWEGLWVPDSAVEGVFWFGNAGVTQTPDSYGFLCSDQWGDHFFGAICENAKMDFRDGDYFPIEWSFETGRFAPSGLTVTKFVKEGRIEGIFSDFAHKLRVLIRTDARTEWAEWDVFSPCDKAKNAAQGYRASFPLGRPPSGYEEATWFQVRVEGIGHAEIRAIDLDFSPGGSKSGSDQCSVIGASERDLFEINTSSPESRWN